MPACNIDAHTVSHANSAPTAQRLVAQDDPVHRLLHVVGSPRRENSESEAIAAAFLDAYRANHPAAEVDTLDLYTEPLPVYDEDKAAAKMQIFGGEHPDETVWSSVRRVFERFDAADRYLFGVPMWNHGVPWALKHFIDTVTQPGMAFSFNPEVGYSGLLKGKTAVAIYTGAVWGPGVSHAFGHDFHSTYFEDWLRFVGIDKIHSIRFQRNLTGPSIDTDRYAARRHASELGALLSTSTRARTAVSAP
jgi:FMN-dependent NADH-azoreductase